MFPKGFVHCDSHASYQIVLTCLDKDVNATEVE